jgi:Fe-S-cluster containining protein
MPDGHPPLLTAADCASCGACCREAFDTVPVTSEDGRALALGPDWVATAADGWREVRRVPSPTGCGTRCRALRGDGAESTPFRCAIYADRPEACSGLEEGSEACRFARRRVGLPA